MVFYNPLKGNQSYIIYPVYVGATSTTKQWEPQDSPGIQLLKVITACSSGCHFPSQTKHMQVGVVVDLIHLCGCIQAFQEHYIDK